MQYLQKILSFENCITAFKHIAANKGSPGIDGITLENFSQNLEANIENIIKNIYEKTYAFQPALSVNIPGKERVVYILTVSDRVVTQAVNQILSIPVGDYFHASSYAYRFGKSAIGASKDLFSYLQKQKIESILKFDIYKFFDEIDHRILQKLLHHAIGNAYDTLHFIQQIILQPRCIDGQIFPSQKGVCQGSSLSPLLSNLYLTPLDRFIEKSGYFHIRFSDDIVIPLKNKKDAGEIVDIIENFLFSYLNLKINREKISLNLFSEGFHFLGFHISQKGRIPGDRAKKRLFQKIDGLGNDEEKRKAVQQWEAYYGKNTAPLLASQKEKIDTFPIVNVMQSLFHGNKNCYAKAYKGKMRTGYYPVKEVITQDKIVEHLLGKETLGIYVLDKSKVYFSCLDLDIDKMIMDTFYHNNSGEFSIYADHVLQTARKIERLLEKINIFPILENSGYKGFHLWIFFDEAINASNIRNFWKYILSYIDIPKGIKYEIFPKESSAKYKLGSLIKLPLGLHPLTGTRTMFIDKNGDPISEPLKLLQSVKKVSFFTLQQILLNKKELNTKSDLGNLLENCNVVNYLCAKAKREKNLSHFERIILLYTLAQLGESGQKYLHHIIGYCYNYSYNYTQKQIEKKHPSPMGCRRIQEIMGDVLEHLECRCSFSLPHKGYASPILHAYPQGTKNLSRR